MSRNDDVVTMSRERLDWVARWSGLLGVGIGLIGGTFIGWFLTR